jgi:hypothetical protein
MQADYSLGIEIEEAAEAIGIDLRPWQRHAADVMASVDQDSIFLYREIAIICSRQNGKTKILVPRIKWGLDRGRRIIHTAQNRLLPRKVFKEVAKHYPDATVRFANGQESIDLENGGSYMIVAPQRGARGESADDLIVDELREMEDFDFIAAAEPTLTESANPQVIYLSNAGTAKSLVLNDLRARGIDNAPGIAYMEWSAGPEKAVDDRAGWLEANPSIGHGNNTLEKLQALFDRYQRAGELAVFETEHLCRWVESMSPRLVADVVWQQARRALESPVRPAMGISVHPNGRRASAVISWAQSDGSIGMRVEADVTGDPIDLDRLAADLMPRAQAAGIQIVGFDSWTDQHLARYFPQAEAIVGPTFANASERFVRLLETGGLHWQAADAISDQLPYASRKSTQGTAWVAEASDSSRPITAVLAGIRAVWLASNPQTLTPNIY